MFKIQLPPKTSLRCRDGAVRHYPRRTLIQKKIVIKKEITENAYLHQKRLLLQLYSIISCSAKLIPHGRIKTT